MCVTLDKLTSIPLIRPRRPASGRLDLVLLPLIKFESVEKRNINNLAHMALKRARDQIKVGELILLATTPYVITFYST